MNDVQGVIHSAGIISFSRKEKKTMYKVNIEGTTNMVNIALEKKSKAVCTFKFSSGNRACCRQRSCKRGKKMGRNKTTTQYAFSKHHSELEVWRGIAEGLNAVILNPSTVLGYGDWNTSSCRILKQCMMSLLGTRPA